MRKECDFKLIGKLYIPVYDMTYISLYLSSFSPPRVARSDTDGRDTFEEFWEKGLNLGYFVIILTLASSLGWLFLDKEEDYNFKFINKKA